MVFACPCVCPDKPFRVPPAGWHDFTYSTHESEPYKLLELMVCLGHSNHLTLIKIGMPLVGLLGDGGLLCVSNLL